MDPAQMKRFAQCVMEGRLNLEDLQPAPKLMVEHYLKHHLKWSPAKPAFKPSEQLVKVNENIQALRRGLKTLRAKAKRLMCETIIKNNEELRRRDKECHD